MADTQAQQRSQHQPAAASGSGVAIESPQGSQIAQLQALADGSAGQNRHAHVADIAQRSAQTVAQRQLVALIDDSPRSAAQRKAMDGIRRGPGGDAGKASDNGLPSGLKQGIETLSGVSMDGVQVHYNSARPAQLGALAYAQGKDIHLGPGHERHLPHEAWHVVQQAQGRVQATKQMKQGVALNDDVGLEREADVMGQQALQLAREAGSGGAGHWVSAHGREDFPAIATSGGQPVQLIASQVTLDHKNAITVRIVGRPPNVYSGSAGDHLTAFSVRQLTLMDRLDGLNFWNALAEVDLVIAGLADLPGIEVIAAMADRQRNALLKAWGHMRDLRLALPTPLELLAIDRNQGVAAHQLSTFQELISTYFEVVELIPFSTINVAAKSQGLAGKGKGESAPLRILRTREAELAKATQGGASSSTSSTAMSDTDDDTALFDAFLGVFDANAAALVAAELDARLRASMGGAFPKESKPVERVTWMVNHHLATMWQSFPHVMVRLGGERSLAPRLTETVYQRMRNQWSASVETLRARIRTVRESIKWERSRLAQLVERATAQRAEHEATIKGYDKEIDDSVSLIDQMNGFLGKHELAIEPEVPEPAADPDKPRRSRRVVVRPDRLVEAAKVVKQAPPEPKSSKKRKQAASVSESSGEEDAGAVEKINKKLKLEEAPESEASGEFELPKWHGKPAVGPTVQIRVGKNGTIINIEFAGRSPSPLLSGGMGAHTTAWIVHLDRLRAALVGRGIGDFANILKMLWKEATAHGVKMLKVFENKDTTIGVRQRWEAEEEIVQIIGELEGAPAAAQSLSLLQNALRALLNYTNNVPGATLESTNTDGNNEGRSRGILVRAEGGVSRPPLKEIKRAIAALLDVKVMAGRDYTDRQRASVRAHHRDVIERAYPNVWEWLKEAGDSAFDFSSVDASTDADTDAVADADALTDGDAMKTDAQSSTFTPPGFAPFMVEGGLISMDVSGTRMDVDETKVDKDKGKEKENDEKEAGQDKAMMVDNDDIDVNAAYQYEDVDMYRILEAEVANYRLQDVDIVPPASNMHAGELQTRLTAFSEYPGVGQPVRTLLVPFNIGNYHWVGIAIVLTRRQMTPSAIVRYVDPLQNLRGIPPQVLAEIHAVFPGAKLEDASGLLQSDGTSCGPLTIENLLLQARLRAPLHDVLTDRTATDRLRERHARLLALTHPEAAFRERQRSGHAMTLSFDVAAFRKRKVTYTKRGTARIFGIAQTIRGLSDTVRQPIYEAFEEICAPQRDPMRDAAGDYATLRIAFGKARDALLAASPPHEHARFLRLMRKFWGAGDDGLALGFDTLKIADFDEMIAIGQTTLGKDDQTGPLADIKKSLREDKAAMTKPKAIGKMPEEDALHEEDALPESMSVDVNAFRTMFAEDGETDMSEEEVDPATSDHEASVVSMSSDD
jgi:hypothetical protein